MDKIPARALPIIFTDLNDGLGKRRGDNGEIYISDSEEIGIGRPSLEHYNGTTFRDIIRGSVLARFTDMDSQRTHLLRH